MPSTNAAAPSCPYCGNKDTKVTGHTRADGNKKRISIKLDSAVLRIRKCANGHIFKTGEIPDDGGQELYYCTNCDSERWSFLSVYGPKLEAPLNLRQAVAMFQPRKILVQDCGQHGRQIERAKDNAPLKLGFVGEISAD